MSNVFYPPSINDKGLLLIPSDFSPIATFENFPALPSRPTYPNTVNFILTQEFVDRIPYSPLEVLALTLWDDMELWKLLADLNLPREPYEWRVGDLIRIPTHV